MGCPSLVPILVQGSLMLQLSLYHFLSRIVRCAGSMAGQVWDSLFVNDLLNFCKGLLGVKVLSAKGRPFTSLWYNNVVPGLICQEVHLGDDHTDKKRYAKFRKMVCLLVMDHSKRRTSLLNLLDAFSIETDVVESSISAIPPKAFAIVDSSPNSLEIALTINEAAPNCRFIFLTSSRSILDPAEIRKQISHPTFLTLPVTVIQSAELC